LQYGIEAEEYYGVRGYDLSVLSGKAIKFYFLWLNTQFPFIIP
jgi:hypothetical protein